MSLLWMPVGVVKELEKIERSFLWGDSEEVHKLRLIDWKTISRSVECGGLGVNSFRLCNAGLLLKWPWRFGREKHSLWKRVICEKYGLEGNCLWPAVCNRGDVSGIWKDVQKVWTGGEFAEYIEGNRVVCIGDGSLISFWEDKWLGNSPLCEVYARIYSLAINKRGRVKEFTVWNGNSLSWAVMLRRPLRGWEWDEWDRLLDHLASCKVAKNGIDRLLWREKVNGSFSASVFRKGWDRKHHPLCSVAPMVWTGLAPPKVEYFIWRALKGGIPVMEVLHRRSAGLSRTVFCNFCGECPESIDHLFFHCHFSWSIWGICSGWWGISWAVGETVGDSLKAWDHLMWDKERRKVWRMLFFVVVWSLWLMRNEICFGSAKPDIIIILEVIRRRLVLWLMAKFPGSADRIEGCNYKVEEIALPATQKIKRNPGVWEPPSVGCWKINVDGSAKGGSARGGIGGVLRDHEGKVIMMFRKRLGMVEPELAELVAVVHGLKIIAGSSFFPMPIIVVESDSKSVISWLRNPEGCPWIYNALKNEFIEAAEGFGRIQFVHVGREANSFADTLAKGGARGEAEMEAWL